MHVTFYKRASVFRTIGRKWETLGLKAMKREHRSQSGDYQRNMIVLDIIIAQPLRAV